MTLAELKTELDATLRARGGVSAPDIDVLSVLVHHTVLDLALKAIVLSLKVTDHENNNILRCIEPGVYLRIPEKAVEAEDEIDLDETLLPALVVFVAAKLARDVSSYKIYTADAERYLQNHHFKIYETEEELDG